MTITPTLPQTGLSAGAAFNPWADQAPEGVTPTVAPAGGDGVLSPTVALRGGADGDKDKPPNPKGLGKGGKCTDRRSREYLRPDEVETLWKAAKGNRQGFRDHMLIRMMFQHGLRCGEAARMQWADIDFKDARILVRRLKGSRSGEHPLEGWELRALRRLQREQQLSRSRWVWLSERQAPMSTDAIAKMIERLGKRWLPDLKPHPHTFRHSCGYALAQRGVDTRRIQEWLGHRDIRHTSHYTALSGESLRGIWG